MLEYCFKVSPEDAGSRLDVFLSRTPLGLSRNQVQGLIEDNLVRVNGQPRKASHKLGQGEEIRVSLPPPAPSQLVPEPIPLDILFEDEHLIAVNKPAGLVAHPGAGDGRTTLVHGLLHHCGRLADLGAPLRPGIVHRLDKNTSGVLVAARNDAAYRSLSKQFKERTIYKEYSALVYGALRENSGRISAPIYRHHKNRKKMGVVAGGREAHTSWWIEEAFSEILLLKVVIKTGRTHQIRVHLAHVNHPLVGDATYGGKRRARSVLDSLVRARLVRVKRQMLHARKLVLQHPAKAEMLELTAPLPEDMLDLLRFLRKYGKR